MPRSRAFLIATAALVFVGACSGRRLPNGAIVPDSGVGPARDAGPRRDSGVRVRDAGVVAPRDSGVPAGIDASVRDAGPARCGNGICEAGETSNNCPSDCRRGPCRPGEEGCSCNSTFDGLGPDFEQDDCNAGMRCVPWDIESGRSDLTGPVQSCVLPCRVNSDCGVGRFCVDTGFDSATGADRVCADQVAADDEWCGLSRNTRSRLPGVQINTPDVQVGCRPNAQCSTSLLQDLHPDEGVCIQLCGRRGDPPCGGATPYCNPRLFMEVDASGNTIDVGVCSEAQLGVGAWCGADDPNRAGLTRICDTSTFGDVVCVGLGISSGLCMEVCSSNGRPCQTVDSNGPMYCLDGLLTNGDGICMSNDCHAFPDSCPGRGTNGLGQFCLTLVEGDQGICTDRTGPPLAPTQIDSSGSIVRTGDDCQASDLGLSQCPEPATCVGTPSGGACVVGCDPADPNYCSSALASVGLPNGMASCTSIMMGPDGTCGGD